MSIRLALLGAPGSGKGTQAHLLSAHFGIKHISTGMIFRDHIQRKSELGLMAKEYINKGDLVPDELTVSLVYDTIMDCGMGFVLDGFPRSISQAQAMRGRCEINAAICLEVSDDEAVRRLSGRWVCDVCGANYHESNLKVYVCIACAGVLKQRTDDTYDAIVNRLAIYHGQTEPVIGYYQKEGLLIPINGQGEPEQIFKNILSKLK
jgi:adenylate kinase